MRSSGRCPGHWSSAMPPPRTQSDPTRGQQEDGDHGIPVSWSTTPASFFVPQCPTTQSASKRTQMRTCVFYTKYLYQILLYCTKWDIHPHLLSFLLPITSHLHKMLDNVKKSPFMLSYQQQICFFSSLKPVVCVFIKGVLEEKKKKDWGGKPRNHRTSLGNGEEMSKVIKGVCDSPPPFFLEPPKQHMSTEIGRNTL